MRVLCSASSAACAAMVSVCGMGVHALHVQGWWWGWCACVCVVVVVVVVVVCVCGGVWFGRNVSAKEEGRAPSTQHVCVRVRVCGGGGGGEERENAREMGSVVTKCMGSKVSPSMQRTRRW
jgi:hypothetical protein